MFFDDDDLILTDLNPEESLYVAVAYLIFLFLLSHLI